MIGYILPVPVEGKFLEVRDHVNLFVCNFHGQHMAVCTHKVLIELDIATKLQCIPNTRSTVAHLPKAFCLHIECSVICWCFFSFFYHTFPITVSPLCLPFHICGFNQEETENTGVWCNSRKFLFFIYIYFLLYFIYLFTYLLILAALGLRCCSRAFL